MTSSPSKRPRLVSHTEEDWSLLPPGVLRPGVEFGGGKFAAQIPNLFLNKGTADAPGLSAECGQGSPDKDPSKETH